MAANQYGIDMADIYRTTAAVKGARTKNKLADLNLSEKEYDISQRPARQKRANFLTDLRGTAASGGEGADAAMQQLVTLDPENGPKFIEALSAMDKNKREAVKRSVDQMGQMSAYVLQGGSPEEQERRYSLVLSNMPEESKAKMPPNFDPNFMQLSLSKAVSMDKLLEAPKVVSAGTKEQQYRLGRKTGEFDKPIKKTSGSGGAGGLKSADESLMYRQSAEILGGIFDQQGNITNLDPEVRNKVQAIATEAANIFVREGNITRSEAVTRAAKAYGLNVSDVPTDQAEDPLGLL